MESLLCSRPRAKCGDPWPQSLMSQETREQTTAMQGRAGTLGGTAAPLPGGVLLPVFEHPGASRGGGDSDRAEDGS